MAVRETPLRRSSAAVEEEEEATAQEVVSNSDRQPTRLRRREEVVSLDRRRMTDNKASHFSAAARHRRRQPALVQVYLAAAEVQLRLPVPARQAACLGELWAEQTHRRNHPARPLVRNQVVYSALRTMQRKLHRVRRTKHRARAFLGQRMHLRRRVALEC